MKWESVKLEQIASINGGKRLPKGHDFSSFPTNHLYIRARDIGNNRITASDPVYLSEHTSNKLKLYTVSGGDLVVTIVGANIGDVGYVSAEFSGANLTENAARLRIDKNVCNPKFLSAQLSTSHAKEKFQFIASGAAQGKLGLYKIKSFDVILPPMKIQSAIAEILSAYDDLIENNRRRIQLLEQAARLLYKEWFVNLRFPGHEHVKIKDGVPDGWEKGAISDLGEIITGKTPPTKTPENFGGNIPFVKTPDMHRSRIIVEIEEYLSERGAATQPKKNLPAGAILVVCIGAKLGVVSITSRPCQKPISKSMLSSHVRTT